MKSAVLSACVLLSFIALSQANTCSSFVNNQVCKQSSNLEVDVKLCSAQYEGYPEMLPKFRKYINEHIATSYQYTLMATHFGNHEANRPGFERLYQKLSDQAWEDCIDLVKYNAKRGGYLENFSAVRETRTLQNLLNEQKRHPISEYSSLASAMDLQKQLASGAYAIHKDAVRLGNVYHDPEISSFIEKEFAHKHADTIRMLSGHLSDMNGIMSDYKDFSLSLYLFDEYLQKTMS